MHTCKIIHTPADKLEEELTTFFKGRTIALSSLTQSSTYDPSTGKIYVTVVIIYG